MSRSGGVAFALVLSIAAGCTPNLPTRPPVSTTPAATATSRAPATSAPTPEPSPSASVLSGVFGSDWERIKFGEDNADPRAAAYGRAGAVLVGATCVGPGEAPDCTAAAWHQTADGSWRAASVEDAAGATMYEVVYADRFIALGWRIEQGGNVVRAILWTSGDGRDWKRTRSVEIGDCSGEGPACGHADGLVATEGGLVIIGDVAARGENGFFGALASTDGGDWTRIDRATFGGDPNAYISAAMPWKDGVVALVGSGDGPMSAWLTNDGVAWEQVGTLGEGIQSIGALATNGEVLVAAEGESAPEGFRTTLWTARDGEQFRRAGAFDGLILTKLAYVGDTGFVAVGHDEGRPQVVASTEGRSWYRAVPGLPQIECAPWWLAGGPLTALYVGSCGAWIAHAG